MAALCMSLWLGAHCSHCVASTTVSLNIDQLLDMVELNNKDVAGARANLQVTQQGLREANAAKLPEITASLNVNYLGDITLMSRHFSDVTRAPMPHLGNELELTVYQPVYAGGAITAGVDLARSRQQMSATQLSQVRQQVSMQAIACFLELFKAYNLRQVYTENIAITNRLVEQMQARHSQGVVLKNDITRYELRLSTLNYDLLTINNRIDVLNHDLCLMLGLADDTVIDTQLTTDVDSLPLPESQSQWLSTTLANNPTLKTIDISADINAQQRRLLMADKLPKIGLVAGDSFSGPVTFEVPVIDKNYNFWYFGLSVKYNISSLFKTSKSLARNSAERSEIFAKREAAEQQLDRTIVNLFTQYTQAYSMLATEEKNVELAAENYRIVENRYNNQLALLTDMLDASTAKLDADVRLVNARVNIVYYYYQLKYNSGTL
jgi:outer membrane protein TolC